MKKLVLILATFSLLLVGCSKTGTAYSVSYEKQDYENETHTATLFSGTEMFDYDYNTKEKTNQRKCSDNQEEALNFVDTTDTDFIFEPVGANTYKADIDNVSKYVSKLSADGYACTSIERTPTDIDAKYTDGSTDIRIIASCNGVVRIFCINAENNPIVPPYIIE